MMAIWEDAEQYHETERLKAEIARLQAALLKCATIPHMGQYTGSRVNAAIAESKPWSEPT
jgi:hypothetical protein